MLEKLLSLLLHAKGGAVATVLVLGASGALVTATVENGVSTISITQPSQSSTGSQTTSAGSTTTNNTVTQQILALFNRTKAEDDPTAPATGNGCKDAAHAKNEQVDSVNDVFKTDHAAILALGKDAPKTEAARDLVKAADRKIKDIRKAAVEAIHDLFESDACHDKDDEDKDEDKDEDDNAATTGATTGTSTGTTTTTTTTVAISGTDAKAIADAAIAEMDKVVAELKTKLAALPAATTTTNTKGEKAKNENKSGKSGSNKGKGHSEGRSHEDND